MVTKIACIASVNDQCGEGVVWSAAESAVYWTDINRFLIHRLDTVGGDTRDWHFNEPVVALSLTTDAEILLVALGSRLLLWQPRTDARVDHGFRLGGWPRVRLNDGRADPCGNFWVGSMRNNVRPDGSSCRADGADGKLFKVATGSHGTVWREDIGISNTLCWSPDRKSFYFGDSLANTIYRYDFNDGAISNEQPFYTECHRGLPDGSAIDSEGFLWNCRYGGGCIVRVAPDGTTDRIVEMPVLNPTTCTFGGKNLKTLFVTSAGGSSEPGNRLAGNLFELTTEITGLPECRFALS